MQYSTMQYPHYRKENPPRICNPVTKISLEISTRDAHCQPWQCCQSPPTFPKGFIHILACMPETNVSVSVLLCTVLWKMFAFHGLLSWPFSQFCEVFLIWNILPCDHLDYVTGSIMAICSFHIETNIVMPTCTSD